MSVNVGQVFVRVRDREALIEFLVEYLGIWGRENLPLFHGLPSDSSATVRRLVGRDGKRRVLLLPSVRGWMTILEGEHRTSDLFLASLVSAQFKTRTIGMEVGGCVFNCKWALFESGECQSRKALLSDEEENSQVMPLFKDAERLAWDEAQQQGLPVETLFLRAQDFADANDASNNAACFELSKEGAGVRLQAFLVSVRMPLAPVECRVVLDQVGASEGKMMFAVENRFLWGRPDAARVEHLAALLRRLQARYSRFAKLPLERISFNVFAGPGRISLPPDLEGGPVRMEGKPRPEPPPPGQRMGRMRFEE